MAELAFDVFEQILVRMDVKDLIRYKSVCKSWLSFICTPRFVKAHLNHNIKSDRDNQQLGHRRICHSLFDYTHKIRVCIVGSCNGLVCICPDGVRFVVTNPLTREQKKLLPPPPYRSNMDLIPIGSAVCWGFGYDTCADDYKVIAGFKKGHDTKWTTYFYVFTLKSNTWNVIGEVRHIIACEYGILCGGTLYWLTRYDNKKKIIISLDLSTNEFKEIPKPKDCDTINRLRLGVLEDCLCIYVDYYSYIPDTKKTWVMKNNKWELCIAHCCSKYDIAHFMPHTLDPQKMHSLDNWAHVHAIKSRYISENIFVKSLVSPHLHNNNNN
ncbi:F-box/kelch-repeat protein At3g23880-like [Bidens hawaiensis]|uniref:F-box/kelch-repeat protein At3g23880-like n=1 Tax=Bidens hawaiensis TaxID=980011 RepID=UPI004049FAA5